MFAWHWKPGLQFDLHVPKAWQWRKEDSVGCMTMKQRRISTWMPFVSIVELASDCIPSNISDPFHCFLHHHKVLKKCHLNIRCGNEDCVAICIHNHRRMIPCIMKFSWTSHWSNCHMFSPRSSGVANSAATLTASAPVDVAEPSLLAAPVAIATVLAPPATLLTQPCQPWLTCCNVSPSGQPQLPTKEHFWSVASSPTTWMPSLTSGSKTQKPLPCQQRHR